MLYAGRSESDPLADGLGAEPRPGTEAHAGVERQADEGDVHALQVQRVRQAQERGDAGEARRLQWIGGAVAFHVRLPVRGVSGVRLVYWFGAGPPM